MSDERPNPTADQVTKLAFRIADEWAMVDISSEPMEVTISGETYYDLATVEENVREELDEEV